MDKSTFKAAVKLHQQINALEKTRRIVADRAAESLVFEGNSGDCSVTVKAHLLADLEQQIYKAESELAALLA